MSQNDDLIPCTVEGEEGHWLFHRWTEYSKPVPPSLLIGGDRGGQFTVPLAICENQNGHIQCFPPEKLCLKRDQDFYDRFDWGETRRLCAVSETVAASEIVKETMRRKQRQR